MLAKIFDILKSIINCFKRYLLLSNYHPKYSKKIPYLNVGHVFNWRASCYIRSSMVSRHYKDLLCVFFPVLLLLASLTPRSFQDFVLRHPRTELLVQGERKRQTDRQTDRQTLFTFVWNMYRLNIMLLEVTIFLLIYG